MNKQQRQLSSLIILILFSLTINSNLNAQNAYRTATPFLGWNSYNAYGSYINEQQTYANLDAFIQKLKPHGYEYFVLDAGWYRDYDLKPGESWPTDGDKANLTLDKYGRYTPSKVLFPNGLKPIIDYAHKHGIKFGLHMMRGVPREAVERDLPIKDSKYSAKDIANKEDSCSWSVLNYGIDMNKPGSQEYYDSMLELLAEWGVDFIKYDDIVHKPDEIVGVADAIEKTGRKIMLSISPGDEEYPKFFEVYHRADMIRMTRDIWDLKEDIDITFETWEKIIPHAGKGYWLDMDMLPFGHIRLNHPLTKNKLKTTRGYERMDNLSYPQKKTFITQRAMGASPLFMGGELTSSPNAVFELITNPDMLACNQNGITGELVTRISTYEVRLDIWKTPNKTKENEGWIGVFNRNGYKELIKISKEQLGLNNKLSYGLYDIWGKQMIEDTGSELLFEIPAEDVIFIRFKERKSNK
ncbi:glycoside hydrolase family 27 protein [Flavivirga eckloniae]|uniref:Alpha-galactosidase n=1 Tax=Flavivirga eckloniae TaxID=1803846 RepID=A0A2K9PNC3_9FLAO|nr:glycoside hydrolase family 27 protein [Flavivirga eckloniae]AUP78535.1 glycoside hydrolase family 27 protein [Flavivirga eckloniae]